MTATMTTTTYLTPNSPELFKWLSMVGLDLEAEDDLCSVSIYIDWQQGGPVEAVITRLLRTGPKQAPEV